jgi:nucleotide-binding universal stress UspA family protein
MIKPKRTEDVMFRHILVATDLTRISRNAVKRADALARDVRAHLHILHVVRDPTTQPWVVEAYGVDWDGLKVEARAKGRRALIAATRRLTSDSRLTTLETRVGAPAEEIHAYAKRHAIDLIVVGTHGRGRLSSTILGSVADAVVRDAECPVMVVRPAPARRRAAAA